MIKLSVLKWHMHLDVLPKHSYERELEENVCIHVGGMC